MEREELFKSLWVKNDAKIVLLVLDGLGGLPVDGKTELERAQTPNLDALAARSACGLTDPIAPGITPGSGPAHLAMFGYDPLKYQIGRGVLETLGVGLSMTPQDLAARGNFATMDDRGIITDRRAGRIPTEKNRELCALLRKDIPEIGRVQVIIESGVEHRFVVLFRGEGLEDGLSDADPQQVGQKAKPARALKPGAKQSETIVNRFIDLASRVLKAQHPANTVLLRGFARYPHIPSMNELFGLNTAAIAPYPMYRGLARLVGMEILESGPSIEEEFKTLSENFDGYDFFYVHVKKTDSYGEDGDFGKKVKVIEEADRFIPDLLALNPDVLAVTGDHSTPAVLKSHSWHPNPFLLYSKYERSGGVKGFSEGECARGSLGRFRAKDELPMMMACALKLKKFGA